VAKEGLGRTLRGLRRLADLTQEELAERSNVSVDVIRQLEQGRKHSARLPTLHALANGLGVELTTLLGDPPAVASCETDGPRFVAVRRAIVPVLWGPPPVRIERVRLAVQYGHAADALTLAKGMRLSKDTPPSWQTWLLLDVARAHSDMGDAPGAVKTLESLRRVAPTWMQHHTLAVAIVRDLWALRNHPPGLRSLAVFLGVAD
jgi:transcriptional regulator with XRE-family HTH domain